MKIFYQFLNSLYRGDNNLKILNNRYLPRWIVLLIDTSLVLTTIFLVFYILTETPLNFYNKITIYNQGIIILLVNVLSFYVFKTYSGIIRHSTITDIFKLALSSVFTAGVILSFNYIYFFSTGDKVFLTLAILLFMLMSFSMMLLFRIAVKISYQSLIKITTGNSKKRALIYGVDSYSIN